MLTRAPVALGKVHLHADGRIKLLTRPDPKTGQDHRLFDPLDWVHAVTTQIPDAGRFRNDEAAYFEFLTTPGVEPTNNWDEQDIRHVVIDRKITQETRGPAGRRWCERIWSTIASCAQQQKAVFPVLEETIRAHFQSEAGPSLLPCAPS